MHVLSTLQRLAALAAEPAETLPLAQVVELTGALSPAGDAWRNGVELAVQEINRGGGLLGKLLAVTTFDAQSSAAGGRAAMLKALETEPLAVLGPVLTEPARGALQALRGRGTPLILGSAAPADATGAAHPATFRAVPSAATLMARFVRWLQAEGKPGRIAILWGGQDPHRTARDAFVREARQRGLQIVAEWVTPGLEPAADVSRLLKAAPDSLLLLVPRRVAGRAIAEVARQATPVRLLGCAPLVDPRTLALAGAGGAEGARAHVLLPPDPESGLPAGFLARYVAANKQPPEESAVAGYLAVALLKAAIDKAGSAEPKALADTLRGLAATGAAEPMLLGDCAWTATGDPDRDSYVVEVRDGAPRTVATLRS
jgi:branched-chain amino acid transport system substrate-binding protein